MRPPEITVAVPVKDRRERMLRCLDALLAQDHPDYEILVLDNESSDGTPEACRERARAADAAVRVVTLSGTVGAVRNRGAELARGRFLAFTDSDCLPSPGWLSAAARALRENQSLGLVQGRTLPEVEPDGGWPATIRVEEFSGRYESCNVVFRRDALLASDGFDEEVGHFWEDTAAGLALRRAGWEATYVPEALVFHDVTYPGFWWHARRMLRNANLAAVVRRYPEARSEVLLWRCFLAARDLRFRGLLAGVLLAPLDRRALWLAAPYIVTRVKDDGRWAIRPSALNPKSHAHAVIYDAARMLGVLRGAVAQRVFLP